MFPLALHNRSHRHLCRQTPETRQRKTSMRLFAGHLHGSFYGPAEPRAAVFRTLPLGTRKRRACYMHLARGNLWLRIITQRLSRAAPIRTLAHSPLSGQLMQIVRRN
jgi:hypothetical protein